ncbi:MAG: DUF481 domain-containing protein [Kofleriaceae bacterium]|nr:DUF481 domain-containing protein [Kofleriaceae bacterium]MBP9171975.1 DUF481 domain-containing protein [Kofleriaceae bacterium]MBP9860505.1 DUF481 domain-containing protein [Kofleriaceae bacterium]
MKLTATSAALFIVASAAAATAQPAPKFEFGKADEVKDVEKVEWAATAEAGLVFTTGNGRTTTITGGLKASRKEKANKFSIDAAGTFARSSVLKVTSTDDIVSADEVERESTTAAQNYLVKLRYDRFLTEFNSLFVAALGGADVVAGKDFAGGGQLGYARLLYKTEKHEVTGEFGYDFSYEDYAAEGTDSLAIHSARAFVGYKGKLSEATSVDGAVETLANVNEQSDDVGPFKDLRATVALGLSTKLTKSISFSFGLTAKFDNVPAPLSFAGKMLDANDPPETLKLDTTTKASLIVTLF